jgi:hypothetical protein
MEAGILLGGKGVGPSPDPSAVRTLARHARAGLRGGRRCRNVRVQGAHGGGAPTRLGGRATPALLPALTLFARGAGGGLQITPYMREIYIIQMIKTKIIDHCNEVAAAA